MPRPCNDVGKRAVDIPCPIDSYLWAVVVMLTSSPSLSTLMVCVRKQASTLVVYYVHTGHMVVFGLV